jgi:transposase
MPRGRKKKTEAKKVGRPSEYRPEMCEDVQKWTQEGIVNHEIAARLGITETTLYDWKNKYPEFSESFQKGENYRHRNVINALYKRCIGYEYTEVTKEPVVVTKQVEGQSEKLLVDKKMVTTKKVKKQMAPDVNAIEFYLTNKLPDEFKHKSEVNNKISGNLTMRSEGLSEKEKAALIKEVAEEMANGEHGK